MGKDKIEYIREKRRKLCAALLAVVFFGALLYFLTILNEKTEEAEAVSGGLFDIARKLDDETTSSGENTNVSSNILKVPILVPFTQEEGRIMVKGGFKIKKKTVPDAVFEIGSHADTIYSKGFLSGVKNLFCKGTMKKGSDRFFIYFCEEKTEQ